MSDRSARLRIAHVTDCYAPRLGGIEVQVAELGRMQAAAGHRTTVVTATPGHGPRAEDAALPVHRVVAPMPFELPVHPRAGHHLSRVLGEIRPDVVHVHVGAISPFAWSAVRCATRMELPLVVTVHSIWDAVTRGVYRALDAACGWSRWPMVLTPVSRAAAAPVHRVVDDRTAVRVVPNGLDLTRWRPAGSLLDPTHATVPTAVHVVAVGRLAPRKQPITLLRLLREAAARLEPGIELRATIVGDGPAEPSMRRFLGRNGMAGRVELAGRVDRDALPALLASADVFLAPAVREAFGLAALEARAAGVPIVARRDTGIADFVVPERNGLLGRTEQDLADALVRIASDHDLRRRITAHNRAETPEASSWPAVLAALDGCYSQVREPVPSR